MDMARQKQLINTGKFRENNGAVMRVFNILPGDYHTLKELKYALPSLDRGEIIESVNYLHESGYLHLRSTDGNDVKSLGDRNFEELKAKATKTGIQLLYYVISDPCIEL